MCVIEEKVSYSGTFHHFPTYRASLVCDGSTVANVRTVFLKSRGQIFLKIEQTSYFFVKENEVPDEPARMSFHPARQKKGTPTTGDQPCSVFARFYRRSDIGPHVQFLFRGTGYILRRRSATDKAIALYRWCSNSDLRVEEFPTATAGTNYFSEAGVSSFKCVGLLKNSDGSSRKDQYSLAFEKGTHDLLVVISMLMTNSWGLARWSFCFLRSSNHSICVPSISSIKYNHWKG